MSGFKKLVKGYRVKEMPGTIEATVSYLADATGTDSLPEMGDSLEGYPGTVVYQREKTLLGDHQNRELWTIDYSSRHNVEVIRKEFLKEDALPRSIDLGGEFFSIGVPPNATWQTTSDAVQIEMYKSIILTTVRIDRIYRSTIKLYSRLRAYAGKVNATTLFGIPSEEVLLTGATAEEYTDEDDIKRWKVSFSFTIRNISTDLATGTSGGWNHSWNPTTNKWDKTIPLTYALADIGRVLDAETI